MASLFESPSALDYLKGAIEVNRGTYRYKTQLAEAAGCQLSYLSQVLSGKALLNADHAAGLSGLWQLSELEAEYFIDLVQLERAGTPTLRRRLQRRLEKAKSEAQRLSKRIAPAESNEPPAATYYSAWYYTAVHVLLSLPGVHTEASIAKRLGIPTNRAREALQTLRGLKLAKQESGEWTTLNKSVHIDRLSPLHLLNHSHWRKKSAEAVEGERDLVAYTGIHSLSRADLEKLREMLTEFLGRARKLITQSPEEVLVCVCCDLFQVGD